MRSIRILLVSLAAATALATISVVALAAPGAVAPSAGAAEAQYCPAGEKAARQAAVRRYVRQLTAARKAYYRSHRSAKARAGFVKKQQAQLRTLQRAVAACS